MRTRWSARAATSAGRPCASGPNSHAVGPASSASASGRSRRRPWWPAPAVPPRAERRPRRPRRVLRRPAGAKMLPVDARRHLPLYGSTACPASTTAAAPIASAMRIRVPALPGSEMPTATATSCGIAPECVGQDRRGQLAHGYQSRGSYGVGQCFCRTLGHQLERDTGDQRRVPRDGVLGGEDFDGQPPGHGGLDEVRDPRRETARHDFGPRDAAVSPLRPRGPNAQ